MNRLETRLRRLEQIIGERGQCHCGHKGQSSAAFYYPDEGQERPSDICPNCGGKRGIIAIVYEPQWRNHREQRPLSEPDE